MCWTSLRRVTLIAGCTAAFLLIAPSRSWSECALTDWLFGHGQTTYAPTYSPPNVYVPAAPGCGCAPAAPACGCAPAPACGCAPAATYRISYRPVPTVAYMPVVGVDPCSGCALTTYRPTRAWTYQASLLPYSPYQVGYAPAVSVGACAGCGGCSSCSSPCGGCSSCASPCGGCSSCGSPCGGCSSCNIGAPSGCGAAGGCSSCAAGAAPLSIAPLPGPGEMSRPPLTLAPTLAPTAPVTIGAPTTVPAAPGSVEPPARTYAPGTNGGPISPSAPGAGPSSSGVNYRGPTTFDGGHTEEPPRLQNIPPLPNSGPQLTPTPLSHPDSENRQTSRPVMQATYFQLLQSPPASIPAQTISAPVPTSRQPVDDGGWQHVDN